MTNVNFDLENHIELLLKAGEINLKVMGLLDKANVDRFGVPEPTKVSVGTKAGPGIVAVSYTHLVTLSKLTPPVGQKGTCGSGPLTVSYTHLDVYKRQVT